MTIQRREEIAELILKEAENIRIVKGRGHAGTGDVLSNFKDVAERCSISPFQYLLCEFEKQIKPIENAVKQNPFYPQTSGEPIEQRIYDIINYSILLKCLLVEFDKQKQS